MGKTVLFAFASVVLLAAPAFAQGHPVEFNAGLGVTFPVSDLKNDFDAGWNGEFGVTFFANRGVGLQAEYGYHHMSYQEKRAPNPMVTFALAILLVFLVLAAQYESWGLPFSVLLGTPFAAFGAYFGLWAARHLIGESYVNNVFAQIGLIM